MFDARLYLLLPEFLSLCAKSYPRWILLDARRKMQNWCKIIPTILAHWTLEWPGWCEKVLDLLLEASSVLVHIQRPVHVLIEVRMIKPLLIIVKATFFQWRCGLPSPFEIYVVLNSAKFSKCIEDWISKMKKEENVHIFSSKIPIWNLSRINLGKNLFPQTMCPLRVIKFFLCTMDICFYYFMML